MSNIDDSSSADSGSDAPSRNRGLTNAANRLERNAQRNLSRGQTNSAGRLQSNADRLRNRASAGVSPEEAAAGVLPSEQGRSRSNRSSFTPDGSNPYQSPPFQNPELTGIPDDPPGTTRDPAGRMSDPTGTTTDPSGDLEQYRSPPFQNPELTGIPDDPLPRSSSAQAQVPGDLEQYRSPPFQNPELTGIPDDPPGSTTRDPSQQTEFFPDDNPRITDRFNRGIAPRSQSGGTRSASTPRDANNDGVLDSVEPYQFDAEDTVSPTQDTRIDPGDWNRGTDPIDPVSENLPDSLDDEGSDGSTTTTINSSEVNSDLDASLDRTGTDARVDDGTESFSRGFPASGSSLRASGANSLRTSRSGAASRLQGSQTTSGRASTSDRYFDSSTDRNLDADADATFAADGSLDVEASADLDADIDVDAEATTPALRRAARLLGDTEGQVVPGRGLERASQRVQRNADRFRERFPDRTNQGLDRAAERLDSNAERFRNRFDDSTDDGMDDLDE